MDRFRATYATLMSWRILVLCGMMIVVAGVAGPFGTFEAMDPLHRFGYWAAVVVSSILLGYTAYACASAVVAPDNLPRLTLAGILFGACFNSVAVWGITIQTWLWGTQVVPTFWELAGYCVLVHIAVGVLRLFFKQIMQSYQQGAQDSEPSPQPAPRIARRLPDDMQGDILHLSVRDHFVEIFTDVGSVSVRMRFRDALDELDGINGYRVHRSHWVSHAAVQGIEKDQARVYVCLPEGRRVPVSRNYHAALEDAGWL